MATVVIIDDEKEICEILEDVFNEEEGFTVLTAENGLDGLALIEKHSPDVTLLDVKLSAQMDGVEVLREIRKRNAKAKVIVITGYVEEKMEQEIKQVGVDGYIEKPFSPPQIIGEVQAVMNRE